MDGAALLARHAYIDIADKERAHAFVAAVEPYVRVRRGARVAFVDDADDAGDDDVHVYAGGRVYVLRSRAARAHAAPYLRAEDVDLARALRACPPVPTDAPPVARRWHRLLVVSEDDDAALAARAALVLAVDGDERRVHAAFAARTPTELAAARADAARTPVTVARAVPRLLRWHHARESRRSGVASARVLSVDVGTLVRVRAYTLAYGLAGHAALLDRFARAGAAAVVVECVFDAHDISPLDLETTWCEHPALGVVSGKGSAADATFVCVWSEHAPRRLFVVTDRVLAYTQFARWHTAPAHAALALVRAWPEAPAVDAEWRASALLALVRRTLGLPEASSTYRFPVLRERLVRRLLGAVDGGGTSFGALVHVCARVLAGAAAPLAHALDVATIPTADHVALVAGADLGGGAAPPGLSGALWRPFWVERPRRRPPPPAGCTYVNAPVAVEDTLHAVPPGAAYAYVADRARVRAAPFVGELHAALLESLLDAFERGDVAGRALAHVRVASAADVAASAFTRKYLRMALVCVPRVPVEPPDGTPSTTLPEDAPALGGGGAAAAPSSVPPSSMELAAALVAASRWLARDASFAEVVRAGTTAPASLVPERVPITRADVAVRPRNTATLVRTSAGVQLRPALLFPGRSLETMLLNYTTQRLSHV